jgi:hypothetical protein
MQIEVQKVKVLKVVVLENETEGGRSENCVTFSWLTLKNVFIVYSYI